MGYDAYRHQLKKADIFTPDEIVTAAKSHFTDLPDDWINEDIASQRAKRARHIVYWMTHSLTSLKMLDIGGYFDLVTFNTVNYGIKKVEMGFELKKNNYYPDIASMMNSLILLRNPEITIDI